MAVKIFKTESLGVDFGGVIISRTEREESIKLSRSKILNAFESLRQLVDQRFGSRIFVVSKTDQETQEKIIIWLLHKNFYELTGIKPENIHFCWERQDKANICQKLGITHFIDDRLENLVYLSAIGIRNLYLFQGRQDEMQNNIRFLPLVQQVNSWKEILVELLPKRRGLD